MGWCEGSSLSVSSAGLIEVMRRRCNESAKVSANSKQQAAVASAMLQLLCGTIVVLSQCLAASGGVGDGGGDVVTRATAAPPALLRCGIIPAANIADNLPKASTFF